MMGMGIAHLWQSLVKPYPLQIESTKLSETKIYPISKTTCGHRSSHLLQCSQKGPVK